MIPSFANWKKYADEFFFKWQFPNCAGAIDGKNIKIATPPNSGSTFFNYKSFPSIVLMAVCSANYKFTVVNIGASGQESVGGIFSRSQFRKQLLNGSLPLPNPAPLPNSDIVMPYVLVGDEAFPLP